MRNLRTKILLLFFFFFLCPHLHCSLFHTLTTHASKSRTGASVFSYWNDRRTTLTANQEPGHMSRCVWENGKSSEKLSVLIWWTRPVREQLYVPVEHTFFSFCSVFSPSEINRKDVNQAPSQTCPPFTCNSQDTPPHLYQLKQPFPATKKIPQDWEPFFIKGIEMINSLRSPKQKKPWHPNKTQTKGNYERRRM